MKKLIALALVVVMVLGCISLVACNGGGGDGATTTPPAGGETTPAGGETTPPPDETTTPPETTLEDILGYGAGITAVHYEMEVTVSGMPSVTTEVWIEQDKIRTEMTEATTGETVVMIADFGAGTMYLLYPDLATAMEIPFDPGAVESPIAESQSIPDYDYTILGTEVVGGEECMKVQYSSPEGTVTMWIWVDNGFPIKTEVATPQGTFTSEFSNIEFGDIDDSMFEVPPNYTVC